ncbi:MAG: transposase [Holdemanella sp.]|nr:transposase [Holdemanella sp.]
MSILRAIGMSKSTYCYYKESKHLRAVERRKEKDKEILNAVLPIYTKSRNTYGYRRILLKLDDEVLESLGVGRDRIRSVLTSNGLIGRQGGNGKYHSYKGDNGEDKRNLLLEKVVDEKNIRLPL